MSRIVPNQAKLLGMAEVITSAGSAVILTAPVLVPSEGGQDDRAPRRVPTADRA